MYSSDGIRQVRTRLSFDRLPRPGRRRLLLALGLLVTLAALGGVTATLALDHPMAAAGIGTTEGSEFGTVADGERPYVADLEFVRRSPERTWTRRSTMYRRPNGTEVRTFHVSANGSVERPEVTSMGVVAFDESGYVRRTYRAGAEPDVVEPHVLQRGNRTVTRFDDSAHATRSTTLWYTLGQVSFVPDGSVDRNGTSLRVYDVVGRGTDTSPLLDPGDASGRVLVDGVGRLRAANVTIQYPHEGRITLRYDVRVGESRPLPDWVSTARTLPPAPPSADSDRPTVTAYRFDDGLVLVADGPWTPPPDAELFVLVGDGQRVRAPLDGSRSMFRPHGNDTHLAFVVPTADGATV